MKFKNRWVIAILSLVLLGSVFYYFSDIVTYILISWVLAMTGQPVMRFFREKLRFNKFKFGESLASILTLFLYILILFLLIIIFVPLIVQQANNFTKVDYHEIYVSLEQPIQAFNDKMTEWGLLTGEGIGPESFRDIFMKYFNISRLGGLFGSVFSVAGSFLIAFFSIFFISFFFLQDSTIFTNIVTALVPNKYEEETRHVIRDISTMLRRYFVGILIQITIITILVSSALALLGVQNALLIGFFAAIINVIPYIGPIIGALFGIIITISANLQVDYYMVLLPKIIKVIVVFGSMQLIDNFILQPIIYSNSAKAHPLEIFIVILVAAKLGGIPGMILAIPTYIVIRVIARAFLYRFKVVKKLTGGMGE